MNVGGRKVDGQPGGRGFQGNFGPDKSQRYPCDEVLIDLPRSETFFANLNHVVARRDRRKAKRAVGLDRSRSRLINENGCPRRAVLDT